MKRIVIIGAGIAGLATGCYGQMNGFETEIFEMHDKPGGLCTSWKRKGYTIDGCIHHLAGASPASKLYPLWQELGATKSLDITFDKILRRTVDDDGNELNFYTDIERLQSHLLDISPGDKDLVEHYIKAIQKFTRFELLAAIGSGGLGIIRMLPHIPKIMKWGPVTLEDFAGRFRNPFIRKAFPTAQYDFPNIPMMIHLSFMAGCSGRLLGWPKGGSLEFAKRIAGHYEDLGGKIHYRSKVKRVITENDTATGIELTDGTAIMADRVISAADGYSTIYGMLGGKYTDSFIEEYYSNPPDEQEMNAYVSLGIKKDFPGLPHALTWIMTDKIELAGRSYEKLDMEIFNSRTGMAPEGGTVVRVPFTASYSYWKGLRESGEKYKAEKERISETVINRLDLFLAGLKEKVEVVDVSTPLTVERFTGNYHGMQVWMPAKKPGRTMGKGLTRTLPGLEKFHMVGQWAQGLIGISTAAILGKKLMKSICKSEGRRFVTSSA